MLLRNVLFREDFMSCYFNSFEGWVIICHAVGTQLNRPIWQAYTGKIIPYQYSTLILLKHRVYMKRTRKYEVMASNEVGMVTEARFWGDGGSHIILY